MSKYDDLIAKADSVRAICDASPGMEQMRQRQAERKSKAEAGQAEAQKLVDRATTVLKALRKLDTTYVGDPAAAALDKAKSVRAQYGLALNNIQDANKFNDWMASAARDTPDAESRVARAESRLNDEKNRRK